MLTEVKYEFPRASIRRCFNELGRRGFRLSNGNVVSAGLPSFRLINRAGLRLEGRILVQALILLNGR